FVFATVGPGGDGTQPGIEPWPEDINFDYGGTPTDYHPEETRVRSETARQAAPEYVRSGQPAGGPVWGSTERRAIHPRSALEHRRLVGRAIVSVARPATAALSARPPTPRRRPALSVRRPRRCS